MFLTTKSPAIPMTPREELQRLLAVTLVIVIPLLLLIAWAAFVTQP